MRMEVFNRSRDGTVVGHGRSLEYLTLGWNAVEAVVAIGAGLVAGSTSLLAFGIDSVIESLSGGILLWRLHEGDKGQRREGRSLRLVGLSLLALAAYVTWESAQDLIAGDRPDASYVGIGLAAASAIVMPLLARAKRNVAARLQSGAMHADSRQSDICGYLSVILLFGLAANAILGWWWADPVAGLAMVALIAKEGLEAVRGRTCACGCPH
jgi:divalent metal cation (Fe/Co/Zn/Cd) transporter